jgi:hypothetical protein
MVLGHWYLVLRGPSFAPLSRATGIVAGALVARAAVAAGSVFLQRELWGAKLEAGWMPFLVDPGVYVAARVVFGFLLPAVLAPLAWRCVRLRSNQSATGILYVNLAFVVIGEIIAEYFLISDGIVL